jgi:hypothetical protein
MRKFEKIEEKVTTEKLVSMTCDICGRELLNDFIQEQECFNITHTGGFGSIFGDGITIKIDICQQCFLSKLGRYINYIDQDE